MRTDGKAGASPLKEGSGGAFAADVALGDLVEADACLLRAVKIRIKGDAYLLRTKALVSTLCCVWSATFSSPPWAWYSLTNRSLFSLFLKYASTSS